MLERIEAISPAFVLGAFFAIAALKWARGPFSAWLALLPGTFAHEMAHFFVALVTCSNPQPPSLRLRRREGGWQLGSLSFVPGIVSAGFVALAPLYLLPPLALFIAYAGSTSEWPYAMLSGYIAMTVFSSALPSRTDWKIAFQHPVGTLLLLGGTSTYLIARIV